MTTHAQLGMRRTEECFFISHIRNNHLFVHWPSVFL